MTASPWQSPTQSSDGNTIAVLDCIREVRPPFSPETVGAEVCTTLATYNISSVTGDRYAGEWVCARFRDRDVSYQSAEKTKSELYVECLPLVNARRCELLDNARLATQFIGLERRTGRGTGRDSIDHAPGLHNDVCNAVAGALVAASSVGSGVGPWERCYSGGLGERWQTDQFIDRAY